MKTVRIALLPGDGIGPDVVAEAVRVLDAVQARAGLTLEYEQMAVGANEYLRGGDPMPPAVFERLREFDAILLGAMGLPGVRWPTGVEMTPQLDLRERLDLYCGLRPIYLFHALDSPLRDRAAGSIDLMLVRESTEGAVLVAQESTGPGGGPCRRHDADHARRERARNPGCVPPGDGAAQTSHPGR